MRIPSVLGFGRRLYEIANLKLRAFADSQTIESVNVLGVQAQFKCVSVIELQRIRTNGGEPEILDFLEKNVKPGDCFYDIGANIGFYSVLAGSLVGSTGSVVAFEPENDNFARLRTNIQLNKLSNVLALPIGLSDHDGTGYLQLFSREVGEGAHAVVEAASRNTLPILLLTLDHAIQNYQLRKPTHIKIDVEGYEEIVLDGMKETLASGSLRAIALETHYFANKEEGRHYFSDSEVEEKRERLLRRFAGYHFQLTKEVVSSYEAMRFAYQLFCRQ